MNRATKALTASGVALALVLSGCGSRGPTGPTQPQPGQVIETEDCDFDDLLEGDSDCKSKKTSTTKKPSSTKKAAPTQKKPASSGSGSKKK